MNNDIRHINETLSRLESKFDVAVQNFVTTKQLADSIVASDAKHLEYEKSIALLQEDVRKLREKDAEQQGFIDANKQYFNRAIAIASLIAVILGALWWLPTLLHR